MTEKQKQRYSRHLLLPEIGEEGQERLLRSRVLIVGAGGLGSPVALYLAAAGVGTIALADADRVSLSNLQRQIIHFTDDLGRPKVESAADKLYHLNPDCHLLISLDNVTDKNVDESIADFDLIVEATDNPASRYRLDAACKKMGKALVIGGVTGFEGQLMTCLPGSKTYRDVFPENTGSSGSSGSSEISKLSEKTLEDSIPFSAKSSPSQSLPVFSPAVGILGTLMAAEALKFLTRAGDLLTNRLLTFNALTMDFNVFRI